MCGIGGGIGRRGDALVAQSVRHALDCNLHRGPDHLAEETIPFGDWAASLAHNRLAILDLSAGGNQPMTHHSAWISYNGEIYNYLELRRELEEKGVAFHSTSDTEVLLAAWREWGPACLERLNGMFAFALLDLVRGEFVLARDRFGVKPLHYHAYPERILFASTPTPIARVVGTEPDPDYLARGIRFGTWDDDTPITPYRQVRALPGGHVAVATLGGGALDLQVRPWYDLTARAGSLIASLDGIDTQSAVTTARDLLGNAVTLRLRSDVPVAVSLSGGVDSSTIAALARAQTGALTGFSFGHPSRPETEGPIIAEIAGRVGMSVEYVWPSAAEMAVMFWDCLDAQDAPFNGGSVVAQYAVFRAVRAAGFKVLLGGQGGDEVFMGYRKFLVWRALAAARAGRVLDVAGAGLDLARGLWAQRNQWRTYLAASRRYRGAESQSLLRLAQVPAPRLRASGLPELPARQAADILFGGLPSLLRYEDRNSMGNSVESRLPFLDYRLVEWGIATPARIKIRDGQGKWVLRQVAKDTLPVSVTENREKRGFDVRVSEWIEAGLGGRIRDELEKKRKALSDWLPGSVSIAAEFSDEALGKSSHRFRDAIAALWLARNVA